ncbi:MAG: hypothetical protein HZA54_16355 [Planctomycetes bacterium]|nr:hypothetical protein [Planctomycetota bacterium]
MRFPGARALFRAAACLFGAPGLRAQTPPPEPDQSAPTGGAEGLPGAAHRHAQEPAPAAPPADLPPEKSGPAVKGKESRITYQKIQSWKHAEQRVTVLLGNVELFQAGTYLRAESMVGWSRDTSTNGGPLPVGAPGPASAPDAGAAEKVLFEEIYAEGNVRLVRENGEQVECNQVYLNFREHTGMSLDTVVRQTSEKKGATVVIRAEKVRQLDAQRFVADDAEISQCDYGDPHLSLQVKRIDFKRDDAGGGRATFTHLIPQTSGFPLLYFPYYWFKVGQSYPLRSVGFSQSSQFGHTIRSDWGIELRRRVRDAEGNYVKESDGDYKSKKWGDILVSLDWMEKRGIGLGADLQYQVGKNDGFITSYYINDNGPDPDRPFDRQFLPMEQKDRARMRLFNRYALSDKLRLDTEISYITDRFFLPEYFKREFQEGKEQETYAYLRWLDGNFGATLEAKAKLNDWQTQVEYLPRLGARWIAQPLLEDRLYYTTLDELSYVRYNPDERSGSDLLEDVRFDTYHELSYPLAAGPVSIYPFAGGRFTSVDENAAGDAAVSRFLGSAGVRLFAQAHRAFDLDSSALGLHGLRHIMSFDARPTVNFAATEHFTDLRIYDAVDEPDNFAEVALEWRHRLSTRRTRPGPDGKPVEVSHEFLSTGFEIEYYPDPGRDTAAPRPQNYLYPMNWITHAPDAKADFDQLEWSNLFWDAAFTPDLPFSIATEVEWNPQNGKTESWVSGVTATPAPWISVNLSSHYLRGVTRAVSATVDWQASEKWSVSATESFDFQVNQFTQHSVSFRRDVHDFLAELFLHIDRGTGDVTAGFAVTPLVPSRKRGRIMRSVGYDR